MTRHDPAAVLGFAFLGASGVLFIHIQLKMREAGYRTYPGVHGRNDYRLPFEYLRIRAKCGWSAWPAYLVWPCAVAGIILLVFDVFHLSG